MARKNLPCHEANHFEMEWGFLYFHHRIKKESASGSFRFLPQGADGFL